MVYSAIEANNRFTKSCQMHTTFLLAASEVENNFLQRFLKSIHQALAKVKCSYVPRAMLSRLT